MVGYRVNNINIIFEDLPITKQCTQDAINDASVIVGFNIKFDLHWIRRIGVDISDVNVWDCQIAEFILSYQTKKFVSLNEVCEIYGLPPKLDVVKTEYWDKGIDTDKIPPDILEEYLCGDLERTEQIQKLQQEKFETTHAGLYPLFKLHCQDLMVVAEMEWNGIKFNTERALEEAHMIEDKIAEIRKTISELVGGVPCALTSSYDLSAMFYGGVLLVDYKVPVGVFKSGQKVGQVKEKTMWNSYELPRLVEPIEGTEIFQGFSKKEQEYVQKGILKKRREWWSTDADTLNKLKTTGKATKLKKLVLEHNNYLVGWSKLIEKMNWEKDTLHPNLNQCATVTGRLSSSNPNGQNADKKTKFYCESRYEEI
jgi:DNA polymerase I-like protein with 3'-5' exonuclease and polymerase domains